MPVIKNTRARPGAHIEFEVQAISRVNKLFKQGAVYPAGSVLGEITSTKELVAVNASASDGSQNAAAVSFREVDATEQSELAAVNDYHTVFKRSKLNFPEDATQSQIDGWTANLAERFNRIKD